MRSCRCREDLTQGSEKTASTPAAEHATLISWSRARQCDVQARHVLHALAL